MNQPATATFSRSAVEYQLLAREAELRALMRNSMAAVAADASAEVTDFKDVAGSGSMAQVSDTQADHAAHELQQVQAALARLRFGSYGQCEDCGAAIDPRRLQAMPATPYCTSCQAVHERDGAGS